MEAARLYKQAISHIKEDNFKDAYNLLVQAHNKVLEYPSITLLLGKVALRIGRFSDAYKWWGKTLSQDPLNKRANDCIAELDRIYKRCKIKVNTIITTSLLILLIGVSTIFLFRWFQKEDKYNPEEIVTSHVKPSTDPPSALPSPTRGEEQGLSPLPTTEERQSLSPSAIVEEEQSLFPSALAGDGKGRVESYKKALELFNQHEHSKAVELLNTIKEDELKEDLKDNLYFWKGESYYMMNDYEHAIENYKKVVLSWPEGNKFIESSIKLALIFYREGKLEDSRSLLKDLPSSSIPENIEKTYNNLIRLTKSKILSSP
ncbi:MAG: tetratricopeptide repeat protein [Nitrospinota bacterium]